MGGEQMEVEGSLSWSTLSSCSSGSCRSIDLSSYNFEKPSHEIYQTAVETYTGQYSDVRKQLDKSFHGCYTEERQLCQDAIISYVLRANGSTKRQRRPLLVFTAGTMGAGKSYTMRYIRKNGLLDLRSFAVIDQDEIRHLLPEWSEYVQRKSDSAGSMLQKESGYLCEIALEESLNTGRNIIFDSSLKDGEWWRREFARIKKQYPSYRIAILHIKTDLETALHRCEQRAKVTGRKVPRQAIVNSFRDTKKSFEQLRDLADFTAEIDTTPPAPTFVSTSLDQLQQFMVSD